MSVSSLINHRMVDWNFTLSDWSELCAYLERRLGTERAAVLDDLQFTNVNVDRVAVQRLLDDARKLPRLRRSIRGMLDDMASTLSAEPERKPGQGRRVGTMQVIEDERERELVLVDTVTGEELSLVMRGAEDGTHVLDATGWVSMRGPEGVDVLIEWLHKQRRYYR